MTLKRTPLYEAHRALNARIVEFAGYEMPVQYTGVIEEHLRVRSSAGLFDVSHMGEVEVTGDGALEALQGVATNDLGKIKDGECQYTLLCYPDGGVVDDVIIYRLSSKRFLVCVNASNRFKDFEWMRDNIKGKAFVKDLSDSYAQLALQGPSSVNILTPLSDKDPSMIKRFSFSEITVAGASALVSRTGYTGEDGFEIYLPPGDARKVWDAILKEGAPYSIIPVGLGARDTLRLEMGYPLYGHELTDKTTPIEAGLKRFVSLGKGPFIGKEVLQRQHEEGVEKTLIGFVMEEAGVPRAGYEVFSKGRKAGVVTSGTLSPSIKKGIGMAYVEPSLKAPGTSIDIMIRNRAVRASVASPPFLSAAKPSGAGKGTEEALNA